MLVSLLLAVVNERRGCHDRVITIHNNPENMQLPAKFKHLRLQLADVDTQDISKFFATAYTFIEEARAANEGVQVYPCFQFPENVPCLKCRCTTQSRTMICFLLALARTEVLLAGRTELPAGVFCMQGGSESLPVARSTCVD